ncbi:Peptidase S10 serine carboxypeptidase [Penicillium odoratum]|uniref:Peptidase S10 serine carboxypeptidase n=1 Tax=Penicillium odoratum TaxID=1167516 RepID=UPI0025489B76|nr:Peptidase S10 serine carboxypeptidase [Penicillium odoratum]KAJ5752073.1 Peptidase S10 serine carboxypeptidase [Penicillium odoratum]
MATSRASTSKKGNERDPLEALIISLHGNLGQKHEAIKVMVEACGALLEEHEMRVDKCTHLITTEAYLKKKSLPSKIRDAASKGCEIVTLEWLLRSIQKGYIIDTKDFKLETTKTARLRLQATTVKVPKEFRKLIVDETFPGYSEGFTVWVHKEVFWDATLVRLVAQNLGETKSQLVVRRSQLLHDPKANKYYTFMVEKTGEKVSQSSLVGQGKLEQAKDLFQGIFYDATGLHWEYRHDDPKKNKFIYAECNFSDEEASLSVLGTKTHKPHPPAIKAVLNLIIEPGSENQLIKQCLKKNAGGPVMLGKSTMSIHQLRVGICLLKQLLKRPKLANEIVTGTGPASSVLKIYQCLIGSVESKSPASLEWIQREQDFLSYLRILAMASHPGLPSGWAESRLSPHLHRLLGLKHMTLGDYVSKIS